MRLSEFQKGKIFLLKSLVEQKGPEVCNHFPIHDWFLPRGVVQEIKTLSSSREQLLFFLNDTLEMSNKVVSLQLRKTKGRKRS